MNVSIRSHERSQLLDVLPDLIENYESNELFDEAEDLRSVLLELTQDGEGTVDAEIDTDAFETLLTSLMTIDSQKYQWLRSKLGRRTQSQTIHMGFTSSIPIMSAYVGQDPVPPESS